MKRNFTHLDLIQNSDFINWVKTGRESSFSWTDWINLDPENEKKTQIARSIILSIESDDAEDLSDKLTSMWGSIEKSTASKSSGDSDI